MKNGILSDSGKSAKQIAIDTARKLAQEPAEILKTAQEQIVPVEMVEKKSTNKNTLQDSQSPSPETTKEKDLRLIQALETEVKDIQRERTFKEVQEKINRGEAGNYYDVPGGVWMNLAQGGEEPNTRMILPVSDKVKVITPRYIRIDHVFDFYDVVKVENAKITYNWTKLDATIDDILSTGAKPLFSLSYMSPTLSNGDVTGEPKSWSDWEALVKAFIEHYSGARGLSNVYYEVWNEPDLFGKFTIGRDKNYLDLYYHTSVAAARVSNVKPFKLGGPATTQLFKGWVEKLLTFASQNALKLDFISWHRYSKSLSDYEQDYINARSWTEKYPQYKNIELMITESGPNSENDSVYDGSFSAIHTLATSALLEGNISKLFTFEIKDGLGPDKYWGRWGLFTHEKWGAPIAKPRFNALVFLNQMEGFKVNVSGQGSWIKAFAKEENGTVKTLIVNYDPSGKHSEAVPITFANLPSNTFSVRRSDFGGGSEQRTQITTEGNVWKTVENFKPNSAAIIEISPL